MRSLLSARTAAMALAATLVMAGAAAVTPSAAMATPSFVFTRLTGPAGSTRYDTAAAAATAAFPTADTVVLTTGQNFPDALASNFLAGVDDAPILLTPTAAPVAAVTLNALQTLKTKNVVILGLQQAVSQGVQDQLTTTASTSDGGGNLNVTRIGGASRYDTMKSLVEAAPPGSLGSFTGLRTAIVASGANFPDALAAGPISWAKRFPTVLTDPNNLSPQASVALKDLGIQQVLIEGGPSAVSPAVEASIHTQGIITLARFAGADRSETSEMTADYAISNFGFANTILNVATGEQGLGGADALVGGPYAGRLGPAPILVTDSSATGGRVVDFATEHTTTVATGVAFGGGVALPDATLTPVAVAAIGTGTINFGVTTGAGGVSSTLGTSRQFVVGGLGSTPVDLKIASCADVISGIGGATFAGTNPGGTGNAASFPTTNSAAFTVVGGAAVTPPTATDLEVVPQKGGTVTFSISDSVNECVVPVVYSAADDTSTNHNLELNSAGQPVEPFAVGGATFFIPAPAASGVFGGSPQTTSAQVVQYDGTQRYFVQNGNGAATYTYNPGDVFQLFSTSTNACQGSTLDVFANRLSVGDAVTGNYNPSASSTFCLVDQAPSPPSPATTIAPMGLTATASNVGITVRFLDSVTTSVASYNIYRALANVPLVTGAPFTCPVLPTGDAQAPPPLPFTLLASVPDKSPAGQVLGTHSFIDGTVTAGTSYCYAVSSVDGGPRSQEGDATGAGPVQAVAVLPPPSTPAFVHAVFSGATPSVPTVKVIYNEAISCPLVTSDGSQFHVTYTNNGVTQAVTLNPNVPPFCDNSATFGTGASLGEVTLTISSTAPNVPPSGSTLLVKAQSGTAGTTVSDTRTPSNSQLTSDAVQTAV
jgi:putative cell wall-binding protein